MSRSSVDSDMLSISSGSDDTSDRPLCAEVTLPYIGRVVSRLLSDYRRAADPRRGKSNLGHFMASGTDTLPTEAPPLDNDPPSSDNNGDMSTGTSCAPNTVHDTQRPSRKRKLPEDNDDAAGGNDGIPPPKIARLSQRKTLAKLLACPFWKHDTGRYSDCFRNRLCDVSRVKQHIDRKHSPRFYCECCLIIFSEAESHERHIRHERCSWDPATRLEGISHQQRRRLSRKFNRDLSESERWFAFWDIVLPDQPRPPSPYIDQTLSEDLCRYQNFVQSRGPAILLEELRATSEIRSLSDEAMASSLQSMLDQGLNRIHEEWLSTYTAIARPATTSNSESGSGNAQQMRYDTPSSSLVDSGVVITSQALSSEPRGDASSDSGSGPGVQQPGTLIHNRQGTAPLDGTMAVSPITADHVPPSSDGNLQTEGGGICGVYTSHDTSESAFNWHSHWGDAAAYESNFEDLFEDSYPEESLEL